MILKGVKITILTAVLVLIVSVCAGCGGGGGGLGVGNRGGDVNPPTLSLVSPTSGSRISDVDFQNDNFVVQFSYYDGSPMVLGTMRVTMKMDNGSAQDVTNYFSNISSSSISSSNIATYTKTLFPLQTNDRTHTITMTCTVSDAATNVGLVTASFTVYPAGPSILPPN